MNKILYIKNGKVTYKFNVDIEPTTYNRLKVKFKYNQILINEIKCFEGAKYHGFDDPGDKSWTIKDSARNRFQLAYLTRESNPYEWYDKPLVEYESDRKLFEHQLEATKFLITRRRCILAAEPGTGKTLCAIEALEYLKIPKVLWIGPKSALVAVQSEFWKWNARLDPRFMTYESLKKFTELGNEYDAIVFDESQRVKHHTSQRSQAAKEVADLVRERDGVIYLLTGTPSPKSPLDWWFQSEIACSGFLREGTLRAFENRLSIVRPEENMIGQVFNKRITWLDNENKCASCGEPKEAFCHDLGKDLSAHPFEPSKNEVSYLYKRLQGLVLVKLKKDCLKDLPDKIYRKINIPPSGSMLRAMNLILKTSNRAIEGLTLCRELSDGFQYSEDESDSIKECTLCKGKTQVRTPIYIGPEDLPLHERLGDKYYKFENQPCPTCNGKGTTHKRERKVKEVHSPKEDIIKDLLEEYEDIGRVVIYAGFTASITKLVNLVSRLGWSYIRNDGTCSARWDSNISVDSKNINQELYRIFQEDRDVEKVAYVAHPETGGVALTLTASPVAIFYSNDFQYGSRAQAIERIHRPGMDLNKGATIIDIVHLDTDQYILDNHEKKRDLQALTMGILQSELHINDKGVRYL